MNEDDSNDDEPEEKPNGEQSPEQSSKAKEDETFPHAKNRKVKRVKFLFEEDEGEPPEDKEETAATTLDPWAKSRDPWQLHSECGPNLDPSGAASAAHPWMKNVNPPDFEWDKRWSDVNVAELRRLLDERKGADVEYDRPDLSKESLNDDFQRLFIEVFLNHVREILASKGAKRRVPPLRLMLLGTAGTGKSTTVQTLLQEIKRLLAQHKYQGEFVRVAAPTGCAAFNIRFGATTIHRLFQILNPFRWRELRESSQELAAFQEKMKTLRLVILDEVSMIGKQMMGKISSRCRQAKAAQENPDDDVLGDLSFATVGDPARCRPIQDTPSYDKKCTLIPAVSLMPNM